VGRRLPGGYDFQVNQYARCCPRPPAPLIVRAWACAWAWARAGAARSGDGDRRGAQSRLRDRGDGLRPVGRLAGAARRCRTQRRRRRGPAPRLGGQFARPARPLGPVHLGPAAGHDLRRPRQRHAAPGRLRCDRLGGHHAAAVARAGRRRNRDPGRRDRRGDQHALGPALPARPSRRQRAGRLPAHGGRRGGFGGRGCSRASPSCSRNCRGSIPS